MAAITPTRERQPLHLHSHHRDQVTCLCGIGAKRTETTSWSLTPDAIIAAAMDFIRGYGANNLTMTALACAMDVPVTNIQWHFRTRQDLIDAVAERAAFELYSSLPVVNDALPWEEQLIETFEALRNQLLSLSTFFELPFDQVRLLTWRAIKNTIRQRLESVTTILVNAGISLENAHRVYGRLRCLCRGFVNVGARLRTGAVAPPDGLGRGRPQQNEDPALDIVALHWNDRDHQFRFGLEVLIAGMKAIVMSPEVRRSQ